MFLGILLFITFLASLPWVWMNLFGGAGFAVRPSVIAAIPLVCFYLFKGSSVLNAKSFKVIAFAILVLIIWISPAYYNEYPHWNASKVISLYIYAVLAFFVAKTYILLFSYNRWQRLWPFIGTIFLISCAASFYSAFGSLIPNMNIKSSDEFIHSSLYSNLYNPTQRGGKGIRHTMAIVPVIVLAMAVHNYSSSKLNFLIIIGSLYLILFTFSRAAWLAAFLVVLMMLKLLLKDVGKRFISYFFMGIGVILSSAMVMMLYPKVMNWVWNILSDRVTDNRSTGGRFSVIFDVFTDMNLNEYLAGSNRIFQYSPHNMMLDAFMQTGVFGLFVAIVLFVWVLRIYVSGLTKKSYEHIVSAVFVAPALVRMISAGSGMLHIAELFGLFVAVNLAVESKSDKKIK